MSDDFQLDFDFDMQFDSDLSESNTKDPERFESINTLVPEPATNAIMESALSLKVRRRYEKRNGLNREALDTLLPTLPDSGTDVYILSNANRANGREQAFSFSSFISHFVDLVAPGGNALLYVSVWTMSRQSATEIIGLLRAGKVGKMTLCVDRSLLARDDLIVHMFASEFMGTQHQYVACRNHAKVICCANPDMSRVATVTGSGNLSSQPRIEQYIVSTSPEVYAFFVDNLFEWAIQQIQ